ncbi:MAG TPA: hypothetical protein VIG28_00445 [Leifsonia sp.]
MHPLTLWMNAVAELGDRELERRLLGARRDSGIEQPDELTRDGRWAAAMHRLAVDGRVPPADPIPGCA